MAKVKVYAVSITQKDGVTTTSYFTKKEIADRLAWWLRAFEKITITQEDFKEYKY